MPQEETVVGYANMIKGKNVFVETGTHYGAMVEKVKDLFKEIYSIEIDKEKYEQAKEKFKKYPHIHIIHGNSGELIPKEADVYWLDAHNEPPNANCPILDELRRIEKFQYILIDDFGLMNGRDGFPQAAEIETLVREKWNITTYEKLGQITVIPWSYRR